MSGATPSARWPPGVAPFVVWLCSDAAANVNGRTFFVSGERVSLLTEPKPRATITQPGGPSTSSTPSPPDQLVTGLTNRFALDDHPDMQHFDNNDNNDNNHRELGDQTVA